MNDFEQHLELIPDHERMVENLIWIDNLMDACQMIFGLICAAWILSTVHDAVWCERGLDKNVTFIICWCLFTVYFQRDSFIIIRLDILGILFIGKFSLTQLGLLLGLHSYGKYYLLKHGLLVNLTYMTIAWLLFCYYNFPLVKLFIKHGISPTEYAKTRR